MSHHHTGPMRPTHSQDRRHNRLVRRASRAGVAMLMIAAVNVVVGATSAAAVKGTITVTPSTGLVGSVGTWKQGTTVTINGSGWAPNAEVGWCQGIPSVGAPSDSYCGTGTITFGTADATGHFSGSLVLARYLSIPALGHSVDCGNPAVKCVIGAGDRSDVANTGLWVNLKFAPIRPTVIPGTATVVEGNSGPTIVTVPVTLTEPPITPILVAWTTMFVPGALVPQATPGTDYTATSGNVTFASGQTRTTLNITVTGDTVVEPNEYITVAFHVLSNNAWLDGFHGMGFGVIANDD